MDVTLCNSLKLIWLKSYQYLDCVVRCIGYRRAYSADAVGRERRRGRIHGGKGVGRTGRGCHLPSHARHAQQMVTAE